MTKLEQACEEGRLLDPDEVAEILGHTKRYVWRLGREGRLRRIKPDGSKYVRFDPLDIRDYIERGRSAPERKSRARIAKSPRPRFQ